jgi:hypothetical protein
MSLCVKGGGVTVHAGNALRRRRIRIPKETEAQTYD